MQAYTDLTATFSGYMGYAMNAGMYMTSSLYPSCPQDFGVISEAETSADELQWGVFAVLAVVVVVLVPAIAVPIYLGKKRRAGRSGCGGAYCQWTYFRF